MAKVKVTDLGSLKDKTEDELTKMLATDEIEVGSKAENDAFMEFARTAPGSAERAKMLGEEVPPASVHPIATEPASEPVVTTQEAVTAPEVTEAPKPLYGGYSTIDELVENFEKTRKELEDRDRRHRSSNGKMGQKVKELEAELASLRGAKLVPTSTPETINSDEVPMLASAPVPPNPKTFTDGLLDEKYQDAFAKYTEEMASYNQQVSKFNERMRSYSNVVRKSIEPDLNEFRSMKEQMAAKELENSKSQAWDGLWSDVSDIQDKYGLRTTVPLKTINSYVEMSMNASGSFDPEDVAAAQRYLEALPPADKAAFDKLSGAINSFYDFSTGVPKKAYRTFEGFLHEQGLHDAFRPAQAATAPVASSPAPAVPQQQFAQAMPASAVGATDTTTRANYSTQSEAERAYDALSDEMLRDAGKFLRNEEKVAQLRDLEQRLGLASKK